MKKAAVVLFAALFAVCVLTGCGGSAPAPGRTPNASFQANAPAFLSPAASSAPAASAASNPAASAPAKPTATAKPTAVNSQPPIPNSGTVYVTKSGKKYHREGCHSLRKSSSPITKAEAIKKGYTPCSVCNP